MSLKFAAALGVAIVGLGVMGLARGSAAQAPASSRGSQLFGNCTACHSLEPDRNLTGPSLAGLFGRKAGALASFERYSSALKSSGIVWNDKTLDEWLANPQSTVPGNLMPFRGMESVRDRRSLIDYLKSATTPGAHPTQDAQAGQGSGGMMGGMGGGQNQPRDLKKLDPAQKVTSITYCRDTYRVTTADGKTRPVWELNLRLKTDSSKLGPVQGEVALLPAGMMGDRFSVVFADPADISGFIRKHC